MRRDGYLVRTEDGLAPGMPYFTHGQKTAFDRLAEECLGNFMPQYAAALGEYLRGYEDVFPPQVRNDALRNAGYLFIGLFAELAAHAVEKGDLHQPAENSVCDVIYESEEA